MVDSEMESLLREVIYSWASSRGLRVMALIVYGSASTSNEPADIDVAVFLEYNKKMAKDSELIRYLEAELKAEWDAMALERGLPPLDPLIVIGYKAIEVN